MVKFLLNVATYPILFLPFRELTILNGIHRADMETGQALRTVVAPLWMTICQRDIMHRTCLYATPTGGTGIGCEEWLGGELVLIETTTYHITLESCQWSFVAVKNMLLRL